MYCKRKYTFFKQLLQLIYCHLLTAAAQGIDSDI